MSSWVFCVIYRINYNFVHLILVLKLSLVYIDSWLPPDAHDSLVPIVCSVSSRSSINTNLSLPPSLLLPTFHIIDRGWDLFWYTFNYFYSPFNVIDFYVHSKCNKDTQFMWEFYHDKNVYQVTRR